MKIIQKGIPPIKKGHEVTCRNCGCVFSFLQEEAKTVYDQRDGDYLSIKCPQSGCETIVTKNLR